MRIISAIARKLVPSGLAGTTALIIGGTLAVLLGTSTFIAMRSIDRTARRQTEDEAAHLVAAAHAVTLELVRRNKPDALKAALEGFSAHPQINEVRLICATPTRRNGHIASSVPRDALEREAIASERNAIEVDRRRHRFRMVSPLLAENSCLHCHSYAHPGHALGAIGVTVSTEDDDAERASNTRRLAAFALSSVLVVGFLTWWLVQRAVVRPVLRVAKAAGALARDHRSRPIPVSGRNEIAQLADSFNRMAGELAESHVRLEERVAERTKQAVEAARQLSERNDDLVRGHDVTVFALAKLAESRDPETGEHLERVRSYCRVLADELSRAGPFRDQIDAEFIENIYRSSPLHDVGKVGIPDAILLKPGRLSDSEFDLMKLHTLIGAQVLSDAASVVGGNFLTMAVEIAHSHHERFDGSGYPVGLTGEKIPLAARIVALADVYDALTSTRVYKSAFTQDVARSMIKKENGKHFDPVIVEAFLRRFDEFVEIRKKSEHDASRARAVDADAPQPKDESPALAACA